MFFQTLFGPTCLKGFAVFFQTQSSVTNDIMGCWVRGFTRVTVTQTQALYPHRILGFYLLAPKEKQIKAPILSARYWGFAEGNRVLTVLTYMLQPIQPLSLSFLFWSGLGALCPEPSPPPPPRLIFFLPFVVRRKGNS